VPPLGRYSTGSPDLEIAAQEPGLANPATLSGSASSTLNRFDRRAMAVPFSSAVSGHAPSAEIAVPDVPLDAP